MFASRALPVKVYAASDSAQAARNAIRDGFRTLVAAGGDGTIAGVASVLVDSDATLGVLPVGTLNHFAKALQIPLDFEQAVEVIAAGRTEKIDLSEQLQSRALPHYGGPAQKSRKARIEPRTRYGLGFFEKLVAITNH